MRPLLLLLGVLACFFCLQAIPAADARDEKKKIPRPPGTGILQHFSLKDQDKTSPTGGVCLDGSHAGYYFREGWGEGAYKFLLYYESGGWCRNDRDCNIRAQTALGSSKEWLPFMEASESLGSYFLNTSNNPLYNWNILFMKYCDGSSFSSHVPEPIPVTTRLIDPLTNLPMNFTIYHRGQDVHDAMLRQFVRRHHLLDATDVVVSGCSAGGLSVYLHVDAVATLFQGRNTRVRGLADSGFFLDMDANGCTTAEDIRWLATRANSPALDPQDLKCLGQYGGGAGNMDVLRQKRMRDPELPLQGNEAARAQCMFAQNVLPTIQTPVFSFMSRYDGAQATSINCIKGTQIAEQNKAGERFSQVFKEAIAATQVPHGYLLDACVRHCFWDNFNVDEDQVIINPWINVRGPSGRTAAEIFWMWYEEKGTLSDWREEMLGVYPCPACCGV